MCFLHGVVALNRNDEDAGAAWIGAGVAFRVSTAASIWGASVLIIIWFCGLDCTGNRLWFGSFGQYFN